MHSNGRVNGVNAVVGRMQFLWVGIDDDPGPDSFHGFIERNARVERGQTLRPHRRSLVRQPLEWWAQLVGALRVHPVMSLWLNYCEALLGFDGLLNMTRRQQMNTPVKDRTAGTSPRIAHTVWATQPNLPKCNCESQKRASSVKRSAGSMTNSALNGWGDAKLHARHAPHQHEDETPHA